jgi:hypothetical protein
MRREAQSHVLYRNACRDQFCSSLLLSHPASCAGTVTANSSMAETCFSQ